MERSAKLLLVQIAVIKSPKKLTFLWGGSVAGENGAESKKYDWSKAWIDRGYVLNSLIADSVFGVLGFGLVKAVELGLRTLSGVRAECPEFGRLSFTDLLHYIGLGLIGIIILRFSANIIAEFVVNPIVKLFNGSE